MIASAAQNHATAVRRLRILADLIAPEAVANAFVGSLGSRALAQRSALGSYALARVLPDHPLEPMAGTYATICSTCGWSQMPTPAEEPEVRWLERERTKYGGVRHDRVEYALFDLEAFSGMQWQEPTTADWHTLRLILRTPALLQPTAKPVDLAKALKGVFPSNLDERKVLVELLGFAGILSAPDRERYFDGYIAPDDRVLPNTHYADWRFPVTWWRAGHGLRRDALEFWFPQVLADGDP